MFDKFRENWRKRSDLKARKKAVRKAVEGGTPEVLKAALDALRPEGLSAWEKGTCLKTAVDRQDLGVFRELLSFVDDPNTEISYVISSGRYSKTVTYSPLTYALSVARTHDIALALANNPRTGFTNDDLESARTGGMQDIAGVLAKRMAELRRLEAQQLDLEAAQKSGQGAAKTGPPTVVPVAVAADAGLAPGESWALLNATSVAHVTCAEAIGRRLTEVFNFESRERVLITENLKTGAEAIGAAESFDKLSPEAVRRAEKILRDLTGGDPGAKKSLSL